MIDNVISRNSPPIKVGVLSGGISSERDVSLVSGNSVAKALSNRIDVDLIDIKQNSLPKNLDPENMVIFPTLHGTFGEDGELQQILEDKGFCYAGSGIESSRLCFDKYETNSRVSSQGVRIPPFLKGEATNLPDLSDIIDYLGNDIVIKPIREGSSVGLTIVNGIHELNNATNNLYPGDWLFEKKITGREVTVGIVNEKCMGIVEILPKNGVYDYEHKYTKGLTDYRYPALIENWQEKELMEFAIKSYNICGCRDFARVDFMISEEGECYFLEINTIPGLTPTSLLPKSSSCNGYDFTELVYQMILPAINRFKRKRITA